jgi:hypothetical protein
MLRTILLLTLSLLSHVLLAQCPPDGSNPNSGIAYISKYPACYGDTYEITVSGQYDYISSTNIAYSNGTFAVGPGTYYVEFCSYNWTYTNQTYCCGPNHDICSQQCNNCILTYLSPICQPFSFSLPEVDCNISVSATAHPASNFNCSDGSIELNVSTNDCYEWYAYATNLSSGNSYYTYDLESVFTSLPSGEYSITAYATSGGCTANTMSTVTQPPCEISASFDITPASCYGTMDGLISANISSNDCNGWSAFVQHQETGYSFYFSSGNTTASAYGGNYSITVYGNSGLCSETFNLIVPPNSCDLQTSLVSHTPSLQHFCNEGGVEFSVTSNVCNYISYSLYTNLGNQVTSYNSYGITPNTPNNITINNLYSGDYYLVVQAQNPYSAEIICSDTVYFSITDEGCDLPYVATVTPASGWACPDGAIQLDYNHSASCYWSITGLIEETGNSVGFSVTTYYSLQNYLAQNLYPGTYVVSNESVAGYDGNGNYRFCSVIDTLELGPLSCDFSASIISQTASLPSTCSNGEVQFIASSNATCGNHYYAYLYSSNGNNLNALYLENGTSGTFANLTPGSYTIDFTIENWPYGWPYTEYCEQSLTFTIQDDGCMLPYSASTTNASGWGCPDGALNFENGTTGNCQWLITADNIDTPNSPDHGWYSYYYGETYSINGVYPGTYALNSSSSLTHLNGDQVSCSINDTLYVAPLACDLNASILQHTSSLSTVCSNGFVEFTATTNNTCNANILVYLYTTEGDYVTAMWISSGQTGSFTGLYSGTYELRFSEDSYYYYNPYGNPCEQSIYFTIADDGCEAPVSVSTTPATSGCDANGHLTIQLTSDACPEWYIQVFDVVGTNLWNFYTYENTPIVFDADYYGGQYYIIASRSVTDFNGVPRTCSFNIPFEIEGGTDNDSDGWDVCEGDCDDGDPKENPAAYWYTDQDGDGYGDGLIIYSCTRPANAYTPNELTSINGDCNDYDATINAGTQYLQATNNGVFADALCYPLAGGNGQVFQFEVDFVDLNGQLPTPTYPRVHLDYNQNGAVDGPDQLIMMTQLDPSDLNTADGKTYTGSVSGLTIGTTWNTRIILQQGSCTTVLGPFDYPDVLEPIDIEIFASDITISDYNPEVGSQITVTATVHNPSDYVVGAFYVQLENQYDNYVWPLQTIIGMAPNSSTNVSWVITTPNEPAWCPLQVTIDTYNQIAESNELDNSAIRPFTNGQFNLPGGISATCTFSPAQVEALAGQTVTLIGEAVYFGTAVPLQDPSVAGAECTITLVETGQVFTTYSNSNGNFSASFLAPLTPGTYHAVGQITDFTLTGTFDCTFTVIESDPCDYDLQVSGYSNLTEGLPGTIVDYTITVYNAGPSNINQTTLLDISSGPGIGAPDFYVVPALAVGQQHVMQFSVEYNYAGTYSINASADSEFAIDECNEANTLTLNFYIPEPQPEIVGGGSGEAGNYTLSGGGAGYQYGCSALDQISFSLYNGGGSATGSFDTQIDVSLDGVYMQTILYTVPGIPAQSGYDFSIPFDFTNAGTYSFVLSWSLASNTSGISSYTSVVNILNCYPDLQFYTCEEVQVENTDAHISGSTNYKVTFFNPGQAIAFAPFNILFELSDGSTYTSTYTEDVPNSTFPYTLHDVVVTLPTSLAGSVINVTLDSGNAIIESDENNNEIAEELCYDFSLSPNSCISWINQIYLSNQEAYPSIGVINSSILKASSVQVKFEVSGPGIPGVLNLGTSSVSGLEKTCSECGTFASLMNSFVFPDDGCYTFTFTVDPQNLYSECDESNNVKTVEICVTELPDMRVLSEFIAPSLLNPEPGEEVSFNLTYENIAFANTDDEMNLSMWVNEILHEQISNVPGLGYNTNYTVPVATPWSSDIPGIHIVRIGIDSSDEIIELNELNNEATRAIVVGQASNLFVANVTATDESPSPMQGIQITANIGNNGDLPNDADVRFRYVTNENDTLTISTQHIAVAANSSSSTSILWQVVDAHTRILVEIVNATGLEFTYVDNKGYMDLGGIEVSSSSINATCALEGEVALSVVGGFSPYQIIWQNGFVGETFHAMHGSYNYTIIDAEGSQYEGIATIDLDGIIYFADSDGDGYGSPTNTIVACSLPVGYVANDQDCDDSRDTVYPGAPGTHEGLDNNCNGEISIGEFLPCDGDFNFDGVVNISDMLMFISAFGCTSSCGPFDLTEDGNVNISDVLVFISAYGSPCFD